MYNHKYIEFNEVPGYQCGDLVTGVDHSPDNLPVVSYYHKETEHKKVPGYQCGDLVTGLSDSRDN